MDLLISALDNYTPSQIGENGSLEYTWSNNIRERIVQLSFQLTRVRDASVIIKLAHQTDNILHELNDSYKASVISREEYIEYMSLMYRMIGFTRDIIHGKGEYTLSFMLLNVWNSHYPKLAEYAFKLFVMPPDIENKDFHPYGSWKDIKYLYKNYKSSPLVQYGSQLILNQLKSDVLSDNPSLAAKWVPREKSQFGEYFTELATEYFKDYIVTAKTEEGRKKAIIKAKMNFRKLISSLNKKLDTVQIKQCSLHWSDIEPSKQTSITLHKQKKAFLNVKKDGSERYNLSDRINCANKFKEFAQKANKGEIEVKGERIGLNDFTKDAIKLIKLQNNVDEVSILNAQWRDNSKNTGNLGKMVAMIDLSNSMDGDPLNAAIALGIRVAERSMLGKRIMTFSAKPSWINLSGQNSFVEMVETIRNADWGLNTNFEAALHMILEAIIIQKLKPEEVEDMVFAIFSDMQMDQADPKFTSLINFIEKQYAETGNRLWGKPFVTPHILFWNLKSTSGFPTLSTQKNASMMSGFSPVLLNLFCEEGISALHSCTPWTLFNKSLSNERYEPLNLFIRETL